MTTKTQNAVVAVETAVVAKAPTAKTTFMNTAAREDVAAIVADTTTSKSAKIRGMVAIGVSKSEVALILNIRYQHVRNVLLTKLTTKS